MSQTAESFPSASCRRLVVGWLGLAVAAIFISLVYALVLVLARSGYYAFLSDGESSFKAALVLHVDFSLLVWFMAFAGLLWSWFCQGKLYWLGVAGLFLASVGALLLALSPFLSYGLPIMSDYIPVLDQLAFYTGLGLFALGIVISAFRVLLVKQPHSQLAALSLRATLQGSALVTLLAGTTFLLTMVSLPQDLPAASIPGFLFWGVGHLLQINHLLLLLFCLIWFGMQLGWWPAGGPVQAPFLVILIILCATPGPFVPLLMDSVAENGRMPIYTGLMEVSGSLGLLLMVSLLLGRQSPARSASAVDAGVVFLMSVAIVLFVAGALGGFFITQNNALVPAHYHGVIGAVTLIYMGMAYRLISLMGYASPSVHIIRWQAAGYGLGILLLMAGLLISDIPRKALGGVGAEHGDAFQLMVGRVFMGLGGGLAVIASLVFVGLLFWPLLKFRRNIGSAVVRSRIEGIDRGQ